MEEDLELSCPYCGAYNDVSEVGEFEIVNCVECGDETELVDGELIPLDEE
ncbi:MAG: lysine biosynthesis protein LysW [Candidatus Scalindua sp.]|jgi:hypothetical protein|nr:lysine biosynthesis protein LysW [Candidatus Scalindua sp.]